MRRRSYVIPADAGIQGRGGVLPTPPATWIPAFAGMTIIHPGRTLNTYLRIYPPHRVAWLVTGSRRPGLPRPKWSKFTHSTS